MTTIKNSIGQDYLSITSNYQQVWLHPRFSMSMVSRQAVALGRNERTITDEVVEIMAFLKDVTFATAAQINKGTGLNFSQVVSTLESQHFVNHFVLADINDPSEIKSKDALKIYTLDFAGVCLLSIEGYDMTTWRWTDCMIGIEPVKKALVQTEIYVEMKKSTVVRMRKYEQFRKFRIGRDENDVDFFVSLAARQNSEQIWNYVGFIVESGDEDLAFRDKLANLESVFHETNAGLKYFPNGEATFPKLLVVLEKITERNLNAVKNVIGHVSTWSGADVAIVGLDDILLNGLANAQFYSIQTKMDENHNKIINLGRMNMPLFK